MFLIVLEPWNHNYDFCGFVMFRPCFGLGFCHCPSSTLSRDLSWSASSRPRDFPQNTVDLLKTMRPMHRTTHSIFNHLHTSWVKTSTYIITYKIETIYFVHSVAYSFIYSMPIYIYVYIYVQSMYVKSTPYKTVPSETPPFKHSSNMLQKHMYKSGKNAPRLDVFLEHLASADNL